MFEGRAGNGLVVRCCSYDRSMHACLGSVQFDTTRFVGKMCSFHVYASKGLEREQRINQSIPRGGAAGEESHSWRLVCSGLQY